MLPIAVTASPRAVLGTLLVVLAWGLVPLTSVAAGACALVLIASAVAATACTMAQLATDETARRE